MSSGGNGTGTQKSTIEQGGAARGNGGSGNGKRRDAGITKKEGSGLFEIRSLAASTMASKQEAAKAEDSDAMAAISAATSSSILVPVQPARQTVVPRWLWLVVGGGAVVAVAAVSGVAYLMTQRPATPVSVGLAVTTAPGPSLAPAEGAATARASAVESNGGSRSAIGGRAGGDEQPAARLPSATGAPPGRGQGGAASTGQAGRETPVGQAPRVADSRGKEVATGGMKSAGEIGAGQRAALAAGGGASAGGEGRTTQPEKSARPETAGRHGGDDLDALLDQAVVGKTGGSSAAETAAARAERPRDDGDSLPETLTRDQIQKGMRSVVAKVQACYDQFKVAGTAQVRVVIGNAGRITEAHTTGKFAATAQGMCIEMAVRAASFPRFRGQPLQLTYPFLLQ